MTSSGVWRAAAAGAIAVTAASHGSGGVAFAAHVAGFVVGMAGVLVFRKREDPDARWG
jgi:membrane associated rhomboid family serine protease